MQLFNFLVVRTNSYETRYRVSMDLPLWVPRAPRGAASPQEPVFVYIQNVPMNLLKYRLLAFDTTRTT
jgi:hypothetical protein